MAYGIKPRYWAGGYHWDKNNRFDEFIENGFWEMGIDDEPQRRQIFMQRFNKIQIGDFFILKSHIKKGNCINIRALGIVLSKSSEQIKVNIKWLKQVNDFRPEGYYPPNPWCNRLVAIEDDEKIKAIFEAEFKNESADKASKDSDPFAFWYHPDEDIYQDYLK